MAKKDILLYNFLEMTKGPSLAIRFIVYPIIAVLFLSLFYLVGNYALGYRFNFQDGKIVRSETGIIILSSRPGNATVFIDGKKQKSLTPMLGFMNMTIKGVSIGDHSVRVEKEGFETWESKFSVEPGLVSWGNYVILLPKEKASKPYNLSGSVVQAISSPDKKTSFVISEDVGTKIRFFYEIDLESKEKRKFREEAMVDGQSVRIISSSFDNNKILLTRTDGEKKNFYVLEDKENGQLWNISELYNIPIDSISFSPQNASGLYVKKSSDIYLIDYEKKSMSAVLFSDIVSFSAKPSGMFAIKKDADNYSLVRLSDEGKQTIITKSVPASDSYQFEFLDKSKVYVLLPHKTKELILYKKDSNNKMNSKVLASEASYFSTSDSQERILIKNGDSVTVFDVLKNKFYHTLKSLSIESVTWFGGDNGNILYASGGSLRLVNFNGFYNKKITEINSNSPIFNLPGSSSIYFLNKVKEDIDLSVFSFEF